MRDKNNVEHDRQISEQVLEQLRTKTVDGAGDVVDDNTGMIPTDLKKKTEEEVDLDEKSSFTTNTLEEEVVTVQFLRRYVR